MPPNVTCHLKNGGDLKKTPEGEQCHQMSLEKWRGLKNTPEGEQCHQMSHGRWRGLKISQKERHIIRMTLNLLAIQFWRVFLTVLLICQILITSFSL